MRTAICFCLMMLLWRPAMGQTAEGVVVAGDIGNPYTCSIADVSPGFIQVAVFYVGVSASSVTSAAPAPTCATGWVFLGDQKLFPGTIGTSQSAVTIDLGGCVTTDTVILIIDYFVQGLTSLCCQYPVLPAGGVFSVLDCAGQAKGAARYCASINQDITCPCRNTPPYLDECPELPTGIAEPRTTWGQVKALYR